jgi:hypothetical protein
MQNVNKKKITTTKKPTKKTKSNNVANLASSWRNLTKTN